MYWIFFVCDWCVVFLLKSLVTFEIFGGIGGDKYLYSVIVYWGYSRGIDLLLIYYMEYFFLGGKGRVEKEGELR